MFALLENLSLNGEDESYPPSPTPSNNAAVSSEGRAQEHEAVVYEQDPEDEEAEIVTTTLFDLYALGAASIQAPIYTRALLQEIATTVAWIARDQQLPLSQRVLDSPLYFTHSDGQEDEIWWPKRHRCDALQIDYMARVETMPAFQSAFKIMWDKCKELGNVVDRAEIVHPPPYFLQSYKREKTTDHLDPAAMQAWRTQLDSMQSLWEASASCAQLTKIVRKEASRLTKPITKIVCFGLGALKRISIIGLNCQIQHLTAFTLAKVLTAHNARKFPGAPAVKVILQDPCYQECDRILWQERTPASLDFDMSSPEALLAVDANALVMTAYLPLGMPLVQIIADMYAGNAKEGPGMMLCDSMALEPNRRWYTLNNRSAPHVARFLLGGYSPCKEPWVGFEEDLMQALHRDSFWLEKMTLWLRKE
jgi:hypothetical protein